MNEYSNRTDNLFKGFQRKRLGQSFMPRQASLMLCLALGFGAVLPKAHAENVAAAHQFSGNATLQQQSKVAKGVVTDSNGEPLIGVSVTEKGTNNAYVTNLNCDCRRLTPK